MIEKFHRNLKSRRLIMRHTIRDRLYECKIGNVTVQDKTPKKETHVTSKQLLSYKKMKANIAPNINGHFCTIEAHIFYAIIYIASMGYMNKTNNVPTNTSTSTTRN